jgi:threonine dehydratase
MAVAATGANVLEVSHHRAGVPVGVTEVEVLMVLETRSPDHQAEILRALTAAGYRTART